MSKEKKEEPIVDSTKEGLKIKKKPSLRNKPQQTTKLDLTKTKEDAIQEQEPEEPVLQVDEKEEKQELGLQEVGSAHEEKVVTKEVKEEVSESLQD